MTVMNVLKNRQLNACLLSCRMLSVRVRICIVFGSGTKSPCGVACDIMRGRDIHLGVIVLLGTAGVH